MASVWSSAVSAGLAYAWGFVEDAAPVLGVALIVAAVGIILSRLRS